MVNLINSKSIANQWLMNNVRQINSMGFELIHYLDAWIVISPWENAHFRVFHGLLDANRLGNRVVVKIKRCPLN